MPDTLWISAIVLVLSAIAGTARAQGAVGCPDAMAEWARACTTGDQPTRVDACPAGHVIVVVGDGLRVDVAHRSDRSFTSAGALGASPIGVRGDWSEVPQRERDALAALVACLGERPDAVLETLSLGGPAPRASDDRTTGGRRGDTETPWRAVLAGLIAIALLSRRHGARALAIRALPFAGLAVATFVARRLFVPEQYFHQNGQGPLWIAHALGEPSAYGPGYAQIFSWAARAALDPDGAVFVVQGVLAALVPAAVVAIARGTGATWPIAWAVGLAIATSPIHARLAQSESYFATCAALVTIAAAILATTVDSQADSRAQMVGALAAGLCVSQAALVHPVCWLVAALLPGVVLVGEGATAERVRATAVATVVIAIVVAATAARDGIDVLRGSLGAQWLDPAYRAHGRDVPFAIVLVAIATVLSVGVAFFVRPARAPIAVAVLCATALLAWVGDVFGVAPPWVVHAYGWLHLGPTLAALVALGAALGARRPLGPRARGAVAPVLLSAALAAHVLALDAAMLLPSDAREAARARQWRRRLPEGAVVAHVERAGRRVATLPLYSFEHVRFSASSPPGALPSGADVFLYHSSICSTTDAAAYCDALESEYRLEPIEHAVLPAIPSMIGLDYDRDEVEVVLYRVRGRRNDATTSAGSSEGREGR